MAVAQRTNCPNELHFDARVLQPLSILGPDGNLTLDRLAIQIQRDLLLAVLVKLHIDRLALVGFLEDDVDVYGGGEEVGHGGRRDCSAQEKRVVRCECDGQRLTK